MSLNALDETLFNDNSGSYTQRTSKGTAPASTTALANYPLCLAMCPSAHAADSFTPGSNSSRQVTKASKAPLSTTAKANSGECLATALSTKAAAFL